MCKILTPSCFIHTHRHHTKFIVFLQLTISSRVWGYCWGEMTYLSNDPTDVRTIFEIVIYKLKPAALVVTHHRLTGLIDVKRKTVFFYSTRRYRWVIISSDPIHINIDICLIMQSSVTKWMTSVCHKSQNRINLSTRYRTWRSASLSFVCWQFPVPATEVLSGKYRMRCQVRRIIRLSVPWNERYKNEPLTSVKHLLVFYMVYWELGPGKW